MRRLIVGMLLAGLAGCDAGPRAVPLHDGDGQAPAAQGEKTPAWAANDDEASMAVPDNAPAPVDEGNTGDIAAKDMAAARAYPPLPLPKQRGAISATRYGDWPLWSVNRKYSADDNAHYQFGKHGGEIGAASYGDYVAAVHAFVHNPPAGTETIRRKNGDTLFYNARQNVFAVMTRDGAPRTLFRPYDGAAYWQNQRDIEAKKGSDDGADAP